MDGLQFDAWTRRRFGMAAGGGIAALLGLLERHETDAKKNKKKRKRRKKKRKKRCRNLGGICTSGGKRKCCGELLCDRESSSDPARKVCCKTEGAACSKLPPNQECCDGLDCCGPEGGTVCSSGCESDRNLKANLGSVDPVDMLQRVRDLPISTWKSSSDDASVRHIGPMAQDFAALFRVGADDRHIHPIDSQGVALAAIQGLLSQLQEIREENTSLAARVAALESGVAAGSSEPPRSRAESGGWATTQSPISSGNLLDG
jgi:hypothetical protein